MTLLWSSWAAEFLEVFLEAEICLPVAEVVSKAAESGCSAGECVFPPSEVLCGDFRDGNSPAGLCPCPLCHVLPPQQTVSLLALLRALLILQVFSLKEFKLKVLLGLKQSI